MDAGSPSSRGCVRRGSVGVRRDDKHRVVPVAVVRVVTGLGVQRHPVGLDAVADPVLFAVEHPLVAVLLGGCRHPGEVAPRLWLGDGEAGKLVAGGDGLEELLFLPVCAVILDDLCPEAGELDRQRNPCVGLVQLLRHRKHLLEVVAAPAPLLADILCDEAGLPGCFKHIPGILPGRVVLTGDWFDVLRSELPSLFLDLACVLRNEFLG